MFVDNLLLVGDSKEIQMRYVMDIICQFNDISGREVSKEKTCLMFSKNVSCNLKNKLLHMSKFRDTNNFGK